MKENCSSQTVLFITTPGSLASETQLQHSVPPEPSCIYYTRILINAFDTLQRGFGLSRKLNTLACGGFDISETGIQGVKVAVIRNTLSAASDIPAS